MTQVFSTMLPHGSSRPFSKVRPWRPMTKAGVAMLASVRMHLTASHAASRPKPAAMRMPMFLSCARMHSTASTTATTTQSVAPAISRVRE
ncbi:hypothetical protein D9M69_631660 [compost metagenome]